MTIFNTWGYAHISVGTKEPKVYRTKLSYKMSAICEPVKLDIYVRLLIFQCVPIYNKNRQTLSTSWLLFLLFLYLQTSKTLDVFCL